MVIMNDEFGKALEETRLFEGIIQALPGNTEENHDAFQDTKYKTGSSRIRTMQCSHYAQNTALISNIESTPVRTVCLRLSTYLPLSLGLRTRCGWYVN
jgi:hypothetical protein